MLTQYFLPTMLIRCDRWQYLLRAIQHIAMTLETIQVLSDILPLVAVRTIKEIRFYRWWYVFAFSCSQPLCWRNSNKMSCCERMKNVTFRLTFVSVQEAQVVPQFEGNQCQHRYQISKSNFDMPFIQSIVEFF